MKFYHVGAARPLAAPSVVTIGNFDGVHLGHQLLISKTLDYAAINSLQSVCISFNPLPHQYFALTKLASIQSLGEKIQILSRLGLDVFYCMRFNHDLVNISADMFIQRILVDALAAKHVVIGEDFRFGAKRLGDVESLRQAGEHLGFTVDVVADLCQEQRRISSTWVRECLLSADFVTAKALLGRDYSITGRVIHGAKLGRKLGFPTANLTLDRRLSLLHGVYVVRVLGLSGAVYYGAASIGTRPAVQGKQIMLEVHLFDFAQDIYGQRIEVVFLHKLRDEWDFASLDELKEQISNDVVDARSWLQKSL